MRIEILFYFIVASFFYVFYAAVGDIQAGIRKSLQQSENTSKRMESVESKVTIVGDNISEIKEILKKNGLWRKQP